MTLSQLIAEPRIRTRVEIASLGDAVQLLTRLIADDSGIDPEPLHKALMAREKLGSTAIGKGVALPHAKAATVSRPVAAMILLNEPLACNTPDDGPIDLFIAFLAPIESGDLAPLAQIVKMLRDETVLRKLRAAASPSEAFAALQMQ